MADTTREPVTVLGLGAMGRALAATLVAHGHPTTVWNRTPGRDAELVAAGAVGAESIADAVRASEVVIAVLLDHRSVHETLDSVADQLPGRHLINLTSTAPEESRELAVWAAAHGIRYLDGGIMATPPMIGEPGATILFSGHRAVFEAHLPLLETLAAAEYFGDDAGLAALHDFALLSGMYLMFAGYLHGAAMVGSVGVSATAFAERAAEWLTAMSASLPGFGRVIDSGDYTTDVQHLAFQKSALDAIARASRDAGVEVDVLAPVQALIDRQVAAGHGGLAFARMVEELR